MPSIDHGKRGNTYCTAHARMHQCFAFRVIPPHQVQRFYTYGCNSGLPVPPATEFTDELNKFCHTFGPKHSVACLETITLITGGENPLLLWAVC